MILKICVSQDKKTLYEKEKMLVNPFPNDKI